MFVARGIPNSNGIRKTECHMESYVLRLITSAVLHHENACSLSPSRQPSNFCYRCKSNPSWRVYHRWRRERITASAGNSDGSHHGPQQQSEPARERLLRAVHGCEGLALELCSVRDQGYGPHDPPRRQPGCGLCNLSAPICWRSACVHTSPYACHGGILAPPGPTGTRPKTCGFRTTEGTDARLSVAPWQYQQPVDPRHFQTAGDVRHPILPKHGHCLLHADHPLPLNLKLI
jgi:hypothetical protein